MFVYFEYFVLIVCFNHCCGASNLIPTAIYSPPSRHHSNGHRILAQLSADATHYHPLYSLPMTANPGELQFSSSFAQPTIEMSKGRSNMVHFQPMDQKSRNLQKPIETQNQGFSQTEQIKTQKVRYAPSRTAPREPVRQQPQHKPLSAHPHNPKSVNQKPIMLLRTQMTPTFTSTTPYSFQLSANIGSMERNQRPKSESNSTAGVRVHSLRFNWPKARPQTQKNKTLTQQTLPKEMQRTQKTFHQMMVNLLPPNNERNHQKNESPKRQNEESQHNFRYDSTKDSEVTETPVMQTEILREATTPSTTEPTYDTTYMTTETLKEEASNSDKKEISSMESDLNYQTQFYDSYKLSEDNYEQNEQKNQEIPNFGSLTNDNSGVSIPENEVNYVHPESYPEPQTEPESEASYADPFEKDTYDEIIDSTKDSPQLKTLLEQFIQQLDLLKFVAAKELQKTNGYSPNYSSDVKDGQQSSIESSLSKTGTTYDEYQNERSFEQNLSNTDSKIYKDTYEKNEGREGRKPCKKPFHAGALPHFGHQY